ncbi:DNA-dependent protein kinase catalytic subunit-like [Asterias amurensis]|uniref:DNA-dependent protein kinase catalytic subunit-like n=1 Tax=Asterias amurensis TaxID=7602 RepID=UPI003AB1750B
MAVAELPNKLSELHGLVSSTRSQHAAEKAQEVVVDLAYMCLRQMPDNEIAYCCSALFNKEDGILVCLNKAIPKDEFRGSKVQILDFIHGFLGKAGPRLLPRLVDIKKLCVSAFLRDSSAKVKTKSLPPLIEVLQLSASARMETELDIPKLIEQFFQQLMQPAKLSQTVKQGIFSLLGVIAEVYPVKMSAYADRLLNVYISTLNQQMTSKTKKPEMSVIAGCLTGLSHFLVNFTQSVEEDAKHSKSIYRFACLAIDRKVDHSRYEVNRAGLQIFAKHAAQFNKYIYEDHQELYEAFDHWSSHSNTLVKSVGFAAQEAFLQQMADMLVEKAAQKDSSDMAVFRFFVQRFRGVIDNPHSSARSLSSAIRGYGFFAAPCKLFMTEDDVRFMFNEMMQKSEQLYLQQGEVSDDKLVQLPSFLEALASIIQQLDVLSDTFLAALERLMIVQIGSYPRMPHRHQFLCDRSVLLILIALAPKGPTLKNFLSKVVYQALVRTCSHPVTLEQGTQRDDSNPDTTNTEADDEADILADTRRISYKDYVNLWASLLDSPHLKEVKAMGMSYGERRRIHKIIYDELIFSILKILDKLDLTSNKDQSQLQEQGSVDSDVSEYSSSDPLHGLQASKPKDFQIFINLVDFCRDLLPVHQTTLFKQWVYQFGHKVILLSSKLPLVSGFYKLLTICMTICSKNQHFKALKTPNVNVLEESMDIDTHPSSLVPSSDLSASFTLFAKFSKEVLVRLKQYKDDLLASCLFLVLSLPHEIVESEVMELVPALQMTFRLGLSYLPLVEAGLAALEGWMQHLPLDSLRPYLQEILPLLDGYLNATVIQGDDKEATKTVIMVTASEKGNRQRKIPVRLLNDAGKTDPTKDSPLRSVQCRIIQLLGSLGGQTNEWLLETSPDEIAKVAVAWDTESRLQFAVPFVDMKPTIELDRFLPRVADLALTSSDRQTKVAACESLHTLVLYMLGKGTQQPAGRQAKSPMQHLYRRIFPVLLRLACDIEQVSKQLFEPLVMQLIHWFTGNKTFESEETIALLKALLDGVIHPTDTSLRDICARCLREFLSWSIKQTSKEQQDKSPNNAKSLLKRIYSMALHPSTFKRLGAALAFNHIYTVFREEDSLVDQFVFEILVTFINSLALAHHDDKAIGTQLHGVQVLSHLERIIRVKADLLNKQRPNRRSPRELPSDVSPTLSVLVIWLLRQCGRPQTECRHQCMMLIYKLTPLLPGRNTPQTWMQNTLKEKGPDYFISRFEGGGMKGSNSSGIAKYPTLSSMGQTFSVKLACTWFDHLLAALDCYTWVLGKKLLAPAAVFTDSAKHPSVLFQSLNYFLTSLSLLDINGASQSLSGGGRKASSSSHHIFTPRESEEYSQGKCTVVVRLWDFLTVLMGNYPTEAVKVIPKSIWQGGLLKLLISCVLQPSLVGFNMADVEIMNNLPKTTGQLLKLLSRSLPANLKSDICEAVTTSITQNSQHDLVKLLPSMFSGTEEMALDHGQLSHLVGGYDQLHQANLLSTETAGVSSGSPFSVQLLHCVFNCLTTTQEGGRLVASNLTPLSVELGGRLLDLAFQLGIEPKALVACLIDNTQLSSYGALSHSSISSRKGVLFYSSFKTLLNIEIARHAQKTVPLLTREGGRDTSLVSSVLNGLLDQITSSRDVRKKYGMAVHSAILTQWGALMGHLKKGCEPELQNFSLLLLRKLLQIDAKFVSDASHPVFRSVLDAYTLMLTDPSTTLTFKTQALDILFFFTGLPKTELALLKSSLDRLVADNFPLKSSEFHVGSPKYNDYIAAFNKILTSMVLAGDLVLLELLISIMCRDDKHVCEEEIQESLASFIKRLPEDKQTAAFEVAYKIFQQDKSYNKEIRGAAIERVCIPLMRLAGVGALQNFFKEHIGEMVSTIEAKPTKVSESAFQGQLVSKTCCFQLVDLMYSRLTKEDLFSMSSVINKAYIEDVKTGKEMTQALTKASHSAKSEDIRGETNSLELRRLLHCAAYNALIAIITCTQTDIKFYNAFLFSENPAKGQFLLDNLVDTQRSYTFEIEMNAPMERKKRFVSIRNQVRDATSSSSDSGLGMYTGPGRYLSSQYLTNSSLSEDIQQFDFSSGVQQFSPSSDQSFSQRGLVTQPRKKYIDEEKPTVVVQGEYIEMESDALNQHECMASITALLKHMQTNKITPEVAKGAKPTEMPGWMANLQKKLSSHSTPVNIKLFIARLIINNNEVFEPYAKFWLSGLIQLVVNGNTGGEGIHYMVVDIVVVLLGWAKVAIPEEKRLANRLLEFLMHFCHHSNMRVLRNNLEMVKTLVECWREIITVPTNEIFSGLSNKDLDKKDNATGIQLLGLILANGFHPIDRDSDIDEDRFYAALAFNLKCRFKIVHAAAAEVIGMAMKQKAEVDKVTEGYLHSTVSTELSQLSGVRPDIFTICIHKIHLHYPEFADSFLNKLLFMLPSLYGQPRTLCLEVIATRSIHIPKLFMEMKSKGIVQMLTHRDEDTQLASLKLINGMLPNLKPTEILDILPAVRALFNIPSPACRAVMYDILMWIYDNFRDEESRREEGTDDLLSMTKDTLLQGLSDTEASLSLRVSNFWSHETRLPIGTLERLVAMLECMYSAGTEHQYLSYATSLLLEMTSKSPDYKREIFEHPLSECKFQDVMIDHSWKQRHVAISTPMFVETQSSQSSSGSPSQTPSDGTLGLRGEIRATQDGNQFTATQDLDAVASRKNAYNWLTGSQDTFADYSSSSASDQSSLLFTIGAGRKSGRDRRVANKKAADPGFGQATTNQQKGTDESDSGKAGSSDAKEVNRLKRRFLKDQTNERVYFARREMKRSELKKKYLDEQRERKFSTVTMYRRYRAGDLPDIQIKHSDLIAPLQALAQRDATMAKLLFSSLFKGIFSQIEDIKTEREATAMKSDIDKHLNTMLSFSTQFSPQFISCIQEVGYYHSKQLTLDPSSVSTASLTSQQLHMGIRLLEENLIMKTWEEERSSKRARGSTKGPSPEISTWIELARLYKALGEFDAVQGIFSGGIGTHEITKTALEAESRGDYSAAVKLYNQAFETDWAEGSVTQVEEDLWDESRLNCCNQLTQWKDVQNYSTVNIDEKTPPDLNKMWTDAFYQEQYMPHMIRSMLKQLMEGGEDDSLLRFIDESMQDTERRAFLESRYSEELCCLYTIQEDYDRAMFYMANCRQAFLQDWSGLGPLMTTSRKAKLQSLQPLTETHEFLQLAVKANLAGTSGIEQSLSLIDRWGHCTLDPKKNPTSIWDDVISNRYLYMDKLANRFIRSASQQSSSQGDQEATFEDRIVKERLWLGLKMADSACQQGNFSVAQKHLKATYGSLSSHEDLRPLWTHSYVQMHQQKAVTLDLNEQITTLLTTFDPLAKLSDSSALTGDHSLARKHQILSSKSHDLVASAILEGGTEVVTRLRTAGKLDKLLAVVGHQGMRPDQICSTLFTKAYSELDQSVQLADRDHDGSTNSKTSITSAYMALVGFCDKMLRLQDSGDVSIASLPSMDAYSQTVVRYTLKAMHYGSDEAMQRYPRLLQLVESCPESMQLMIEEVSDVPSWMFIGWISQMVALLDKSEGPAVHGILTEIAKEYPQALCYPFKISSECFEFDSSAVGKKNRSAVENIRAALETVPLESLIAALEQLSNPEFVFKDWAEDEMKPLLSASKQDKTKIRQACKDIYNHLLDYRAAPSAHRGSQDAQSSLNVGFGNYRRRFAQDWQKKFDAAFGKDGSKIVDMPWKTFYGHFSKLYKDMTAKRRDHPGNLKEYSSWFGDFQQLGYDRELEIPGQYGGRTKPMPEYHVKIAGFDEKVKVLSSMRKPKTIVIRGNDELEYTFLVKGGEDLRQDQRVEQLFEIMNDILVQDAACSQRGLRLVTYQVIPMTPRLGMITWLQHTNTLKEFLDSAMTQDERKLYNSNHGPRMKHSEWVSKYAGNQNNPGVRYAAVYNKANYTDTVKSFRTYEAQVPWDLLRRAFMQLSASPEAFLTLRAHFARTHAVICICQYILGIGDRHLSNFLVSLKTGGMIGIDFGHAFGSATQFLPVPELMPFRLTRQIVNLMLPFKKEGILQSSMVHTLRALRQNHELLINTMDVFIKEPSLDWKSNANKQAKTQRDAGQITEGQTEVDGSSQDEAWYPKEKVNYAKRKLQGANSSDITKREVTLGHSRNVAFKAFKNVVQGDRKDNIRASCPESGLTVETQVACLIDQATDPNLLGRVYFGWEAWM